MSTKAIILIIFLGCVGLFYGSMGMYFWKGWFKSFYHGILKWHMPDNFPQSFDGCSVHARCKYCGEDIMQDSQGNWF